MIKEVLSLGIKGADLVMKSLKEIQGQKEKFKKPEKLSIGTSGGNAPGTSKPGETGFTPEPSKPEPGKEEGEKKKYGWSEAQGDIKRGISSIGGLDTKQLITGVGHSLDVWTAGVSGILSEMGGAAITFKDKMKSYAQLEGDTMSLKNTIARFGQIDDAFKRTEKKVEPMEKRTDISISERSGIVESIGNTMGKITPEFRKAVDKLYGSNEKGKAYDVKETTALAQGHFSALGTDTGFFMQKISDSLGNLPPSFRQKFQAQLFEMIPEGERAKQTDVGIRSENTKFDWAERNKASESLTKENLSNAHNIDKIQKEIEVTMAKSVSELAKALSQAATFIGEKMKEANKEGIPKQKSFSFIPKF